MKPFRMMLPLALGFFALLGSGCVSYEDDSRPTELRAEATLLTLVDESRQLTPEQMEERRRNVISYLIAEGYIYSGDDLVQSASYADQIIRAKLALDGSFELTIYRPERLAHHEVAFDPAGYPSYTYFPGEIGYFGNGFDPYYLPIAPYYGPRYPHYRPGLPRYRDGPRPHHPRPPGQRPDWNQGNRPPPDRDNRHYDGNQRPRPGGNQNRDRDRDQRPGRPSRPTTPPQPGQPPHDPAPPSAVTPTLPPPPPPTQPNPRRSGPNRQPWNSHPAQPPVPRADVPAPAASTAQPQQRQIDHRRFRPELQQQQPPPASPSQPAPASPPPPNRSRSRPEGSPPRTTPPARTPPPQKTAPEPAKEQSTNSDTATPNDINTNGRASGHRR